MRFSWSYETLCEILLYTLWSTNSLPLKMAIEMVDLPIKNGDLLYSYVSYLQLIYPLKMDKHGDFPWFFL